MKVFVCASKYNYGRLEPVVNGLEQMGHEVTLPNSYDEPMKEDEMKVKGRDDHIKWKSSMLRLQAEKVAYNDAILVCNFEKNGIDNYIGGATFLEIFKAFELGKKIFLYNPFPESVFNDELIAMNPIVINGDITLCQQ